MTKFKEISTEDLITIVTNQQAKLIDVRPVNAYNGWQLRGEKPPYYDNDKFVVVHSHYRNRNAYLSGSPQSA